MIDKTHNYNVPKNYVSITMPSPEQCARIRTDGIPFPECKRYSIAFKAMNDKPGQVIIGWEGYSYQCPIIPIWDEEGPWSILQTDILGE